MTDSPNLQSRSTQLTFATITGPVLNAQALTNGDWAIEMAGFSVTLPKSLGDAPQKGQCVSISASFEPAPAMQWIGLGVMILNHEKRVDAKAPENNRAAPEDKPKGQAPQPLPTQSIALPLTSPASTLNVAAAPGNAKPVFNFASKTALRAKPQSTPPQSASTNAPSASSMPKTAFSPPSRPSAPAAKTPTQNAPSVRPSTNTASTVKPFSPSAAPKANAAATGLPTVTDAPKKTPTFSKSPANAHNESSNETAIARGSLNTKSRDEVLMAWRLDASAMPDEDIPY